MPPRSTRRGRTRCNRCRGPPDAAGDVVLPRYHGLSPLTGGPLDSLLRNDGVGTIVVAGVSLNLAIPTSSSTR